MKRPYLVVNLDIIIYTSEYKFTASTPAPVVTLPRLRVIYRAIISLKDLQCEASTEARGRPVHWLRATGQNRASGVVGLESELMEIAVRAIAAVE